MTAGAQGHPGWVDNHPTSLKFLAAAQVCTHTYTFARLQPTIRKEVQSGSFDCASLDNSTTTDADMTDGDSMDYVLTIDFDDADDDCDYFRTAKQKKTATKPALSYVTKDDLESKSDSGYLDIHPNIYMPQSISEYVLNTVCRHYPLKANRRFFSVFRNTKQIKIKKADLRSSKATDESVKFLLDHQLTYLDIRDCELLTTKTWHELNTPKAQSLKSLAIGKNVLRGIDEENGILNMPELRELIITNVTLSLEFSMCLFVASPLSCLTSLDLSGCMELEDISFISHLPLVNLALYNCNHCEDWFATIVRLKKLRRLDISRSQSQMMLYDYPSEHLLQLIEALPELCYLDISGTNLPATRNTTVIFDEHDREVAKCDIKGLVPIAQRPLEVLGLRHTKDGSCTWDNIPAIKILGDANEHQILDTVETLMPYKEQVTSALNELFHQFRYNNVGDSHRALHVVFHAMTLYHYDEHVQISGSGLLFYILRSATDSVSAAARQQAVTLLINAMQRFPKENILIRNGCLTITRLKLPEQVLFEYERLVSLLLGVIRHQSSVRSVQQQEQEMADFLCRISMCLLNSLACQVEGHHKQLVGDLGAVETMLSLIASKVQADVHDDIHELAWSVLWNVTDETPANCQRFLDGDGMEHFTHCHKKFHVHEDLLRNMMGLLGNVAEVRPLRRRLLTTKLITTFTELLKSPSGGIEVSYNAAGVLSHIASDGPDAWSISEPRRESVLDDLTNAIHSWDIAVSRNINYRSFEPILRLLYVSHTPPCQHWAVWALANLTKVMPQKYCPLVVSEGGVAMLHRLLEQLPPVPLHVSKLARLVLKHCQDHDGKQEEGEEPAVPPDP